ncbi:hypothetical protein J6590_077328 [Homalodisca vitripennis]|nr:hypothetical protein J6590_077328 [Homalodisca vitripennis]
MTAFIANTRTLSLYRPKRRNCGNDSGCIVLANSLGLQMDSSLKKNYEADWRLLSSAWHKPSQYSDSKSGDR